jgi:hypothetical protein
VAEPVRMLAIVICFYLSSVMRSTEPSLTASATRLRHDANVRPRCFPALRIDLARGVISHGAGDDHIFALLPFTGVATLCFAVSCSESIARRTSSKLRPVVMG